MIDNLDSKKRYRADVLLEEKAAEYENAGDPARGAALTAEMGRLLTAEDLAGVRQLIIDEKILCPVSETGNWTEVRQFNLMFSTQVGSAVDCGRAACVPAPRNGPGHFRELPERAEVGADEDSVRHCPDW